MHNYSYRRIKVLVTSACNSNCKHCFRSKEKNTELLSKSELIEIVDYGIENNCRYFSFSGGEFFTHPSAYDLIAYCMTKQIKIDIITNGLDIDLDYFSSNSYQQLITFQVSIDGSEYFHDLRRGDGSYRKTMDNVVHLHEIGYEIRAKTVLDETNYRDIVEILSLPWFSKIAVLPVALPADATVNRESNTRDIEYESVVELLYNKKIYAGSGEFTCNHFPNELAIKYNGDVFPCTEAREHGCFLIGNIRDMPMRELIEQYDSDGKSCFSCKSIVVPKCQSCNHLDICKQGCRLRAFRYYGDMSKPDPFACRIFRGDLKEIPLGKLIWGRSD